MKNLWASSHTCCPRLLLIMIAMTWAGCDTKRTVYETMQHAKEQQCFSDPSRNSPKCLERESYDEYERKRLSSPY